MYIAAVYVYLLYYLAVQRYAEMKHTVRSWVLRAYVDHIFFLTEYRFFLFHGIAGSVFHIFFGSVLAVLAFKCKRILRRIVILAQGIALKILPEEKAAHIRMTNELYAEEIVSLAFVQFGRSPYVAYGRQLRIFAVRGECFYNHPVVVHGRSQMIYHAESDFRTFIHTGKADHVIEQQVAVVTQFESHFAQFFSRYRKCRVLPLSEYRFRGDSTYFILYYAHTLCFICRPDNTGRTEIYFRCKKGNIG